jgi:hypothetical protein
VSEYLTVQRHTVAQIRGMVASYLRGGKRRNSTLEEIDGVKRRAEQNGITPIETNAAISAAILMSPNWASAKAEQLRRRYSYVSLGAN